MTWLVSWRTSFRAARREVRRAKGRSTLIAALIGLPVLALTFAAVSYDMFTLRKPESLTRELGTAEASIGQLGLPLKQNPEGDNWAPVELASTAPILTTAQLLALLPPGSRLIPNDFTGAQARHGDALSYLRLTGADLTDPVNVGRLSLLSGRTPAAAGEVVLNQAALKLLDTKVGGHLRLLDGGTYTVVGTVEQPGDLTALGVFGLGFLPGAAEPGSQLIDSPSAITWDQVRALNQHGLLVRSRAVVLDPPPFDPSELGFSSYDSGSPILSVAVVIGGMALLEVVLLAGPAFAVGARRRQRELALVAANGGTPAHVRRVVLADGVVLGAVGAVVGISTGIVTAFGARGLLEEHLFYQRAGGYRVFPLALLAIVGIAIAIGLAGALVPAFTVARQSVVQALAGRRGVVRSRKRWLVLGLAMIVSGALIGVYAAERASANAVLAGLVLAELGAALCTPALVGLIAKGGWLLPLSPRIALRDAARNRASAAPAIAAVMAAVAGTVAMGVYMNSNTLRQTAGYEMTVPAGTAYVQWGNSEVPWSTQDSAEAEAALRRTLPVTEAATMKLAACESDPGAPKTPTVIDNGGGVVIAHSDAGSCFVSVEPVVAAARKCPYEGSDELSKAQRRAANKDPRCRQPMAFSGLGLQGTIVDDGSAIGLLTGATGADLEAAVTTLRAGGVIVTSDRFLQPDGTVHVKVNVYQGVDTTPVDYTFRAHLVPGGIGASRVIISPGAAATIGATVEPFGLIAATGRMPTTAEIDKARASMTDLRRDAMFGVELGATIQTDPRLWVLTGAAILVTIGAAAMATGLAAADGRADLSTLAAVGATPRVRRILSLSQSGVIAGLGSVLGTIAGLGAAWAVLLGLNAQYATQWPVDLGDYPITAPWTRVIVGLLVAPAVAMVGAGLLVRSRLPIERRTT